MEDVVSNYLKIENVDFALFINGKWGSGKTYFIKNQLNDLIKPLDLNLFYFSVNGISSTIELKDLITSKCLSNSVSSKQFSLKDKIPALVKTFRITDSFVKSMRFSDFYFPDKTIVVIDDIERLSPTYSIEEFLGFINREFIEHKNFKVILIGDASQDIIKESNFNKIREKYIRWIIDFQSDLPTVVDSFIENYKSSDSDFYKHLLKLKPDLIKLMEGFNISNLRTLKFFFEIYCQVFNFTKKEFEVLEKEIFYFTLVICNEYREGNLDIFKNIGDLPESVSQIEQKHFLQISLPNNGSIDQTIVSPSKEEIDNFESNFNKYLINYFTTFNNTGYNYNFILPIYNLIISGNFDLKSFDERLQYLADRKQPIEDKEEDPNLQILYNFIRESERSLDNAIELVVKKLSNGEYDIYDFGGVVSQLDYLSSQGLLEISKKELNKIILEGSNKLSFETNKVLVDSFSFKTRIRGIRTISPEAADVLEKKFDEFEFSSKKKRALQNLKNWENSIDKNDYSPYRSIMDTCSAEEIYEKISSASKNRSFIGSLCERIKSAYSTTNAGEFYYDDKKKLEEIKRQLESSSFPDLDKIDKHMIRKLIDRINQSTEHLEKTKGTN